MKKCPYLAIGLAAAAGLFSGALVAQSPAKAQAAQSQPSGKSQPVDIAVDHAGGNGVRRTAGEPQGGGVNPLYESKDKANLNPGTGAASAQKYKDPEDMTTRYRPGNNKTTRADNSSPVSGTASNSAKAKEQPPKKHVANVKYSD